MAKDKSCPSYPRCGEWCDHNRMTCDRIVPENLGRYAVVCGKPTTWLAPLHDRRFPLAYCAEHAPENAESTHEESE